MEAVVSCVQGEDVFRIHLGLPVPGNGFQERPIISMPMPRHVDYRQLVGRTMMTPSEEGRHKLTAITSNWAPVGGINNFQFKHGYSQRDDTTATVWEMFNYHVEDVSKDSGLAYQFETSNRVIIVTEPAFAAFPTRVFALLPLEDFSRFNLWDTTEPSRPCLVGTGVIPHTATTATHSDECLPGSRPQSKCPKTGKQEYYTYSMEVIHPEDPNGRGRDEPYYAMLFNMGSREAGGKVYLFNIGPMGSWTCP